MARVSKYYNVMHGHDGYKQKGKDKRQHGKQKGVSYQIPLRSIHGDRAGSPEGRHD